MKKNSFFSISFLDWFYHFRKSLFNLSNHFLLYLSFFATILVVYDVGFTNQPDVEYTISKVFNFFIIIFFTFFLFRFISGFRRDSRYRTRFSGYLILFVLMFIFIFRILLGESFYNNHPSLYFLNRDYIIHAITIIVFLYEFSGSSLIIFNKRLNPSMIFTFSFIILILFGAGLLSMPRATVDGISFINALFTSTSAVCVTGLTVVDTATVFTPLGKAFILLLIQLGGLGVMTFTSFFGIFFKGESSFASQMILKDMINESNLSQVFKSLMKIILFTLLIELVGALALYISLNDYHLGVSHNQFGVSIFHSVSAFCNAGFSTYSGDLYDPDIKYAYGFQWIISILIIFGGLGFPILFNYYTLSKHYLKNKFKQFRGIQTYYSHKPHVIGAGTKIVVYTTLILIISGMVLFFITEYNNTLKDLSFFGKITASFMGSVTPRTAGFNTVDYSVIMESTALITILLMWIGASPGSTGGGIKTTTFAVSILNAIALTRGKDKLEYSGVEISSDTIRRSFSIMILSLLIIGMSVFFVSLFEPRIDLLKISFECVSAFSTVGLSLGITPIIGTPAKWVLIFTMIIGRVGIFTILMGIVRKATYKTYRYPSENLFIT